MRELFGSDDAPIVVATDLSDSSRPAVEWALELQRRLGRPLRILYVALLAEESALYPLFETSPETLGLQEEIERRADKALARFLEAFDFDADVEAVVRHAVSPAAGVLEYVDSEEAGLLVLGTHGRSGFKRWLMGSVAEDVVRRVGCPVLCCHPEDAAPADGKFGPVLAALDFTRASESVALTAAELGGRLDVDVELLHVVPDPLFSLPGYLTEGIAGPMPSVSEVTERAQRELDEFSDRLGLPPSIARSVKAGRPREFVVAAAEASGASIVVIASRTSAENAAFLGGITHAVLRHAPCLVLVVPPPPTD